MSTPPNGIPIIRGTMTTSIVNGVTITHYEDPRAAPDESSRLVSCIFVWLRGLENRVTELQHQEHVDRVVIRKLSERIAERPADPPVNLAVIIEAARGEVLVQQLRDTQLQEGPDAADAPQ